VDDAMLDDSIHFPPRFWWLKRIIVGFAILLVALVGLRMWWGWYASRQLQAEIDRLVAAGEPIYPEDFDPKEEIPDEQNAAELLQQASSKLDLSDEHEQAFRAVYDDNRPIKDHLDALASLYADNATTFEFVRKARDLDQYDWGFRFRSPVSSMLPSLEEWRMLCKLLCLRAEMHYVRDEDSEAVESLRDNLGLVRAVAAQPSLIAQLVTWAMSETGVSWTERFVISTPEDARNVDPQLVRDMIRELLDDRPLHGALVRAFEVERIKHLDLLKELESGRTTFSTYFGTWRTTPHGAIPDWMWRYGLTPQVRLDMVRVLQRATRQIEAIRREDFGHPDLAIDEGRNATLNDVLKEPFGNWLFYHRVVQTYLLCEASRRLAAVGLALRLYRADHGRLPARLEELVPDYLEALPLDPSSNEARTFGYIPNAPSPIVYSAGRNGVYDGGQYELAGGHVSRKSPDTPFFINGDRPVPKPADDESDPESMDSPKDQGDTEEDERHDNNTQGQEDAPEDRHKKHEGRGAAGTLRHKPVGKVA
jgi:hypothetical protein